MMLAISLSNESNNYFVCVAALAGGLAGVTGFYELFNKASGKDQEIRYLRSILLLAALTILSSLCPLIFAECSHDLLISGLFLFVAGSLLYALLMYEIATRKVKLQHPTISKVLFTLSVIMLLSILLNACCWGSIVFYKFSVLWVLFILSFRFYLFLRHLIRVLSPATPPTPPAP